MKTLYTIAALWLAVGAITGCAPKIEEHNGLSFSIDGRIAGMDGDTAFLKLITDNGYELVDSSRVGEGGVFQLEAPISRPDFYILHFSNSERQITLVPDTSQRISLQSDYGDFESHYTVEGSPESEKICSLVGRIADTRGICDSLGRIFRANISAPNLAGIKESLDSVYNAAYKSQRAFSQGFIRDNPGSLSLIVCVSQYIGPRSPVFDPDKDYSVYKEVSDMMQEAYPDNMHTRKLVSYVEKLGLQKQDGVSAGPCVRSGDKAVDIALPNIKGDTVRLSSYKGKYILLDFWASWSDVSRRNSENLQKLYWKYYYNKNFVVYQVSLDDNAERWKQGLKDQKLNWPSVSDLKVWESGAVEAYGVRQLPASYLIYPDFTVHEINLPADRLDARLLELLGKPVKKPAADSSASVNQ